MGLKKISVKHPFVDGVFVLQIKPFFLSIAIQCGTCPCRSGMCSIRADSLTLEIYKLSAHKVSLKTFEAKKQRVFAPAALAVRRLVNSLPSLLTPTREDEWSEAAAMFFL